MRCVIAHDLFTVGIPLLEKVLRTVGVYAGVLLLLRFGGKRDLAQLDSFDLVVMLLLSNVVQNAIIGNDNSLLGGLFGAAVLLAVNGAVSRANARLPAVARLIEGRPVELVRDGEVDRRALRRLGLARADLTAALRRQNADNLAQVHTAVLDPGGTLVVSLAPEAQNATRADIAALHERLDELSAALGRLAPQPPAAR